MFGTSHMQMEIKLVMFRILIQQDNIHERLKTAEEVPVQNVYTLLLAPMKKNHLLGKWQHIVEEKHKKYSILYK